jgi:hypothetical protein
MQCMRKAAIAAATIYTKPSHVLEDDRHLDFRGPSPEIDARGLTHTPLQQAIVARSKRTALDLDTLDATNFVYKRSNGLLLDVTQSWEEQFDCIDSYKAKEIL